MFILKDVKALYTFHKSMGILDERTCVLTFAVHCSQAIYCQFYGDHYSHHYRTFTFFITRVLACSPSSYHFLGPVFIASCITTAGCVWVSGVIATLCSCSLPQLGA